MKMELNRMKMYISIDAMRLSQKLKQTVGEKNDFYITQQQLDDLLVNACPCECGFQEPYGFVPEAGCPIHD